MDLIRGLNQCKEFLGSHHDIRREVVGMSEVNKLRTQFSKIEGMRKRRMPGIVLKRLKKEKS